ncbi:MAG: filamentous hemagglutinin N-terminal domain-containing protein [Phormidium sp. PBR-2020]|nr:MAG: filamentous hemagglutinin N-terminal domain-containing protein [Phormidium sp. PBR-2020]
MGNWRWGWAFGLGLGLAIAPIAPSQAQIIPDGSLGNEGSLTTPTGTGVQIDGGALRGDNLFHSFQEFSVPTNSEAFFNNPDVANIFSRVTGGSISDIDGLLRANGTANLFLLNPNGIIFGPNARLDIGGSFVASTANSLVFENGLAFNAGESGEAPLLSVNVPLGVQFNDNPGSIEATGATLNVSEGESVTLVGGEISLDDVEINAPAGRIDLVGMGEAGQVRFETSGVNSGFPSGGFGVPADLSRASVSLNETTFDVTGLVGGEIGIQALDVEMRDSFLRGGIAEGLGIEGGQSGNIELDAIGNINISDTRISNFVREGSVGNAGDINIITGEIEVIQGAELNTRTSGPGNAGSVTVQASGSVIFTGANSEGLPSGAFSSVREAGQGNAGTVRIVGNRVEVRDGGQLSSSSFGQGNAGTVIVEAQDTALFSATNDETEDFATGAGSVLGETGQGRAGNVRVVANFVEIRDGAQLNSATLGEGDAGTVTIEAYDTVLLSNGDVFSAVAETGRGNGGSINILANTVEMQDGSAVASSAAGQGNAGSVTIEAHDLAIFSGTDADGIFTSVSSDVGESAQGNGGNVNIIGNRIVVRGGAMLSSVTFGEGNGGSITIHAHDKVMISGSQSDSLFGGVITTATNTSRGNSGNIHITTNNLEVTNEGILSAGNSGIGNAGSIVIEAHESVLFLDSEVSSNIEENAIGNAGNIDVTSNSIEIRDGAQLNSNISGEGNAGTITLQAADQILILGSNPDGFPSAVFSRVEEAGQGDGGDINIIGNSIRISDRGQLSSRTSGEGNAGKISIEAYDTVVFSASDARSTVEGGRGNAGEITVLAPEVEVRDGAQLLSRTMGEGDAGSVTIIGNDRVVFTGTNSDGRSSGASSSVQESANGHGGDVYVAGNVVEIRDGAFLSTSTSGIGDGGNITIEGEERVVISNSSAFSSVFPGGRGNAGDLRILGDRIEVSNSASLLSGTHGEGDGGIISLEAANEIILSDVFITTSVGEMGQGNAGNIQVSSHQIEVNEGANLVSSAFGNGNAGTVTIGAGYSIVFSEAIVSSSAGDTHPGNAGDVRIFGNVIDFINRTTLLAATFGGGEGGNILVQASDRVTFSDSSASSGTLANSGGNAGEVRVLGNIVEVRDGASLSSETVGTGNAGSVIVEANDHVIFSNGWAASNALTNSVGNAGDVRVTGDTVEVRDRGFLSSSTSGEGDAGTVNIEANNHVLFSNSSVFTSVGEEGQGNGGNISVSANTVEVRDGAQFNSSTFGQGNAGTIRVEARDDVSLFNGYLLTSTTPTGQGDAGNVTVIANSLNVLNGSQLNSSAFGEGNAGTVTVEVHDEVIFSGANPNGLVSGALSTVEETGQGNAGGVNLIAGTVELREGTRLSSSNNTTSNANDFTAGDVFVQADRLHLSDRADISANTGGRGGNIQLNTGTTILRRGSTIQTNAEGDFPGGNIIIDTDALVALENSDITANALNAAGGRVIINSQGIFGTEFRDELTPQSDITATSELGAEFSGSVELNTPEVDTATGLVDLSANPIDVAALLDTDPCTLGRESEFYVTGRGGLPPNPDGSLATETTWVDWRSLEDNPSETALSRHEEMAPLVEAQGWHINGEGSVVLSAATPDGSPTPPQGRPVHCSPEQLNR